MQRNLYCFSGLGADEKLYDNISIKGFTLQHIRWLPYNKKESLPDYAARLAEQIKEPKPVLLGVSFGGMLAQEAAAVLKAKQTVIISSIQNAAHFPFYYHWANGLKITDWMPSQLFTTSSPLADYLFGAETEADKKLLRHFMRTADAGFIQWALWAIINWKNKNTPNNLTHIHGTKDRIIPLPPNVQYTIKGGGHLIVYNRAAAINTVLNNVLRTAD